MQARFPGRKKLRYPSKHWFLLDIGATQVQPNATARIKLLKVTPTVWQINLASIYFWQNEKNWLPTVWQINLAKIETWQNSPPYAHICVRADRGCHRRFPLGGTVKKEIKNREEFLM
jgi:hypothetical protein